MRRIGLSALLAALAAAFFATGASASIVTFTPPIGFGPGTVSYVAEAGEVNNLTADLIGGRIVLTDTGTLVSGGVKIAAGSEAHCQASPPASTTTVSCEFANLTVSAGDGADRVVLSIGTVPAVPLPITATVSGGTGADELSAAPVTQATGPTLIGDDGADTLTGGAAADTLFGGADGDTIRGNGGNDTIDGNAGDDPELDGGDGADQIHGGDGNDVVRGGAGDDVSSLFIAGTTCVRAGLNGDDGNDTVEGGPGSDRLCGGQSGAGSDTDTLRGDSGNDELSDGDETPGTTPNADRFDGGAGRDAIAYDRGADVTLTLADDPGEGAAEGNDGVTGEKDAVRLIENATTAGGNDTITGSEAANTIDAGAGNDNVNGGDGSDALFGADGSDTIDGQAGADLVDGGAGSDTVRGGADNDANLLLRGASRCSSTSLGVFGGPGNDTVEGGDGNDSVCGGAQPLAAGASGSAGIDELHGDGGDDVLDDLDDGDPGADRIDGGDGADIGVWIRDDKVTLTLADDPGAAALAGNDGAPGEADAARLLEGAVTGDGDDSITGSAAADNIDSGAGKDAIDADGGDDNVRAGAGADSVKGGDGDDVLDGGGDGADDLAGEAGDDNLTDGDPVAEPGDKLDGGGGTDTLSSYELRSAALIIDLASGAAISGESGEKDTLIALENADGGSGDDAIRGNAAANELDGTGGNDSIDGGAGSDALFGSGGADTITGGADRDELRGGAGNDTLDGRDGGPDQLGCGADIDTASGDAVDAIEQDCERVQKTAAKRTVRCKAARKPKGRGAKKRFAITCQVKPAAKGAKATLKRGTRIVVRAKVTGGGAKLTFLVRKRLRSGTYRVQLSVGKKRETFSVKLV